VGNIEWSLEKRDINSLKPYDNNPRNFTEKGLEDLGKSLDNIGMAQALNITKDGVVLSGNARLSVLKKKGVQYVDAYVPSRELTEAEQQEVVIRMNANQAGEWDNDLLEDNFDKGDLEEWGLDDIEWSEQEPAEGLTDDDEVPEVAEEPTAQKGDIWLLGDHRLMCGDSTDPADVALLMNGNKADMVFTDPPYGVSYADKNKSLNFVDKGNRVQREIANDHGDIKSISENLFKPAFKNLNDSMATGASFYVCSPQGGDQMMMMMMMMMQAGDIPVKHELMWLKNNIVIGRADYHYKHEPILYGWKEGASHYFTDSRKENSVWEFDKPLSSKLHPTMKPVELIEYAIGNSSKKGWSVLDLFGGSGSTLIACEKTDRKCYMMELDPHYVDVIIKRWEDYTGNKAELLGK
jgi:DNA modification methylase